jgi:2-oxoglutarate dehydrogenase E1 component
LRELHQALLRTPEGFTPHPKLQKAMQRRREALNDADASTVDFAVAEQLALASILADGTHVRFTGEDTERGTFGHRHAVFHDWQTGQIFIPLQALPQARAAFEIRNSALSEAAALGFEYGYNVQAPERLVIWEAQYGDFINGAQVIVDEFIVSARAKWGQTPSLVLLLPHGYEGQGPDHSTGRLERFLNLAGDFNMRVANCTTAAQYFHMLRRQAHLLTVDPLPLFIMSPKSLLRLPKAASTLNDLANGGWQPVIDDPRADLPLKEVRRLIWCSGKVYYDLTSYTGATGDTGVARHAPAAEQTGVAIARVEQLYPFRPDDFQAVVGRYPNLREVVWLQEEPENMGAWQFMQPNLEAVLAGHLPLRYIGRPPNASPAEGSSALHALHQAALVEQAYALPVEAGAR